MTAALAYLQGWRPVSDMPDDGTRFVGLFSYETRRNRLIPLETYWEIKMDKLIYNGWHSTPMTLKYWMPLPND